MDEAYDETELPADKNKNTAYEKLAQEIYQRLLNAEGVNTVNVQHNVLIEGKSGCRHQIDVYWEFKMAGDLHRVAIECKNFAKPVSIGRIRDFFGVVYDIGNVKGIFVTKEGYQSGAKKFADYYNVALKEIRKPTDADYKGRIKNMEVEIVVVDPVVHRRYVEPDLDWLITEKIVTSREDAEKIHFDFAGILNNEIFIYDETGGILDNMYELEGKIPADGKDEQGLKHAFNFTNGYMDSSAGRIKIKHVWFEYVVTTLTTTLELDADNIVNAILKDVKTGDIKFINKDGGVK